MGSRAPLFREQAVEFQRQHGQWGEVAALQPLSTKLISWFLLLAAAALIAFLSLAQYARKETAVGYLTPSKGTAKIFVPRRGAIREVHVEEGQEVTEGQALLTIEADQIAADGSDVNVALLNNLESQREVLTKNMRAEEQRSEAERNRYSSLIGGLGSELGQLKSQITLQQERLNLFEKEVQAAEQLSSKGFITAVELRRRQLSGIEQQQVLSSLKQQLSAKQSQLMEAQSSLEQLPTVMAQRVQTIGNELASTEQRILEIKGRGAYVVRAPIAGYVSTLQATAGQSADTQRLQLEILPADAALRAELFVPARAIGFVKEGQSVRLLYDAFPYQHFGTYRGRVTKVSKTILTSSDFGGPIKLNEPAYRVNAALERPDIDADGEKIRLQPDMLLKADVILERRSLMRWLLDPVLSVRM